ncbi:MAG: N-acetylglucosamine-6-phosphate deacetylase [Pedobacter sp.]|nr:MAG: N-acetylglucosamine-6-phosphate deacetylase [Pedobacter sp.]
MAKRTAYTASQIFTGEAWISDAAVIVENELIADLISRADLPAEIDIIDFQDQVLTPAFIDAQLYGAKGRLLSVYPDSASLKLLAEDNLKGGTITCQPTIATNTYEVFYRCIDAMRAYWNEGGKHIFGLHLEGPWINAGKRGAHIEELVQQPAFATVKALLDYGKGVITMITLAPEVCNKEIIDLIQSYNIIISAGHSNASYQQALECFDWGIDAVTHLYNAMSPLQHRAPGLAGAAMDDQRVAASIIPDGHHVDYAAIRIAKKAMGERLFAITDAVTDTSEGPYQHVLVGDKYESNGILSGSALSMAKAMKNLVDHCGIEFEEALRMCSTYPAKVLRIHDRYGFVRKGHRAAFTILSPNKEVVTVIGS